MQLGAEAVFVGSGIFKSSDPAARAKAIVKAAKNFDNPENAAAKPAARWAKPCRAWRSPRSRNPSSCRRGAGEERPMKKVGVLSLQGDFAAHGAALDARRRRAGVRPRRRTARRDRRAGDPRRRKHHHAEAAAVRRLAGQAGGVRPRASRFSAPAPAPSCWRAKCPTRAQESLGLMDIGVERNAYGRQMDSRVASLDPEPEFERRTAPGKLEAVFIRAPIIRRVGGRRHACWRATRATPCWWSRAATWRPRFIPS